MKRLETIKGRIVPAGLDVAVTRNYGETANDKANELLFHLALATASIVILITATIGWREGVVVLIIIPTTILLTLFASWMMGYTINRVSLFALIFSIGILVDDAIVVVENIVRHWSMRGSRGLVETAVEAVAEVGNPTIVATLAIVAALLPMMFVSGLMGPYMSPIPANASIAMLFSFFVAVTVTPWLLASPRRPAFRRSMPAGDEAHHDIGAMGRFYIRIAKPLLKGRARSKIFLISVGLATARRLRAVRHQGRRGQAAAVRQQVGSPGRRRPAERLVARGDRSRAEGGGRPVEGPAGADVDPGLCGNGRAVQLQRPRAPLLSALRAADGRSLGQSEAEGRALPRQSRDRARYPQTARRCPAAAARFDQGRRGPARTAGALDAARRSLRPRRRNAGASWLRKCARPSKPSTSSSMSTTASACRPSASASPSIRRRSSSTASRNRRSTTRSPRSSAEPRSAIRSAAAASSRSRSTSPCRAAD